MQMLITSPLAALIHWFRVRSFFADLQSILCCSLHVKLTDGVLQVILCASMRDGLCNGVYIELSDLWVIVNLGTWPRHLSELFVLFQMTAGKKKKRTEKQSIN